MKKMDGEDMLEMCGEMMMMMIIVTRNMFRLLFAFAHARDPKEEARQELFISFSDSFLSLFLRIE